MNYPGGVATSQDLQQVVLARLKGKRFVKNSGVPGIVAVVPVGVQKMASCRALQVSVTKHFVSTMRS